MPLLVTKYFKLGAFELGLTDSLFGVGMIAGGLFLSVWGGFKRRIATTLMGIIGLGLGVITVGLAPSHLFWIALVGMAITGIMSPITNGPLQAIMQATVKPEMQGRVMSLTNSAATAMSPLSLALAGPLSDWIGIRTWYIFAGVTSLLMGLGAFLIPAIMNVENNHTGNETEAQTTSPTVTPFTQ